MSFLEVVDTRQIYEGDLLSLRVDTIRAGDETLFDKEIVEHRRSVVVVPITDDDEVLLVRQTRLPARKRLLEAPAGNSEKSDDSPLATAQRELREEVGMRSNDLTRIGGQWVAPGYSTEFMDVFVARDLSDDPLPKDVDEDVIVEKHAISTVPDLIRSGEICDSMSIAVLFSALYLYPNDNQPDAGLALGNLN
jgi:ADP-ribose pyrophosphatase